jgi:hypothetical protein
MMPIGAIALIVLCGIAGLAIDGGRDYLAKRNAQNAADFATLAAAKQLALQGQISHPPVSGASSVIEAHDFAANNGFPTIYSTACDNATASSFTAVWFDTAGHSCGATAGFGSRVVVNSPPLAVNGVAVPGTCTGANAYTCFQVVITTRVNEVFAAVLGIAVAYVTVSATAQATPATTGIDAPPPNALTLYELHDGCDNLNKQCFDETKPVTRAGLSCSGSNNCPTFWVNPNAGIDIYGVDGSTVGLGNDVTTLESNGDLVVQSRTTICDPYNGATCAHNTVVGTDGWAMSGFSHAYCQKVGAGAVGTCTTTGQPGLGEVDGNQASYVQPFYWSPTVDSSKLSNCGGLVLNGGAVSGPCANPLEPFLIEPGIYSYIVINHGTYEFDTGLFDITGNAPVNTLTAGGYFANGIDHSREGAADFDLCTGGQPNGCPGLTAGVWIGHGSGGFGAYVAPTSGTCAGGTGGGSSGGGGDATVVSGSGVVFRLESHAGGFVSTNEVHGLTLSGAGVGGLQSVNGAPLLIDEENSSFIHLDAAAASSNGVTGIIYQASSATAGGVELDPGMTSNPGTALYGQVLAYSFTTFGHSGSMDFRNGYGSSVVPGINTSGKNETSIIGSVSMTAAAQPGYSTMTVNYTDEWAMDGYDAYIKVNNGTPIFFSQGIWTTTPAAGAPLPPPNNNPGDQNPAYPSTSLPGTYSINAGGGANDWTLAIPNSNGSTFEAKGSWTWGHQSDIAGAASGNYTATLLYTFPNPNGTYVAITVFLLDGDHCGDYALANFTFKNTGLPGGGVQSGGSVVLVQ